MSANAWDVHGESDALGSEFELMDTLTASFPTADSELLIKTDNLLVRWFQ